MPADLYFPPLLTEGAMTRKPVILGYTRVSFIDSPGVVEQHQAELRRYASENLPEMVYQADFIDDATEERRPLTSRRRGLRMSLTADPGDCIVVAHFDRAFRSARELIEVMDIWSSRGVELHIIDVGLNPRTAAGRMVAGVFRVLAVAERSKSKERGARDFATRRMRGLPLNGKAPPCYRYVGPRGKRRLVQDRRVRQLAARIVEWKSRGWSFEAIYFHMLKHRVCNPHTGGEFSLTALRRLYRMERALQAREAAGAASVNPQVTA
jgi:DNA invertase Pin-like site-specific DNA recombinase